MYPLRTLSHHPYGMAFYMLAASALPLIFALISQYVFGLHPCEMCIWQRYPYALIVALALFALLCPTQQKKCFMTAILLWCVEAVIAAYHMAVEYGWVESLSGCVAAKPSDNSLDALRDAILGSPLVSCGEPAFVFMGLSMAGWNMVAALFFAATGLILLKMIKETR